MAAVSAWLPADLRASGFAMITTATGLSRLVGSTLFGVLWQAWSLQAAVTAFTVRADHGAVSHRTHLASIGDLAMNATHLTLPRPRARLSRRRSGVHQRSRHVCVVGGPAARASGGDDHAHRTATDRRCPAAPYLLLRVTGPGASHGRMALESLGATDGARAVVDAELRPRARRRRAAASASKPNAARSRPTTRICSTAACAPPPSFDLAGAPSRTRMSADGTLAATTVFVSGHSYSAPGFSTRTSIIDVQSGTPARRRPRSLRSHQGRPALQGQPTSTSGASPSRPTPKASTPRCKPAASSGWSKAISRSNA